jgi:hypothetical protein
VIGLVLAAWTVGAAVVMLRANAKSRRLKSVQSALKRMQRMLDVAPAVPMLVRVDGREVPHLAALKLALMTHEPGERVPVEYARADPDGLVTRHEVKVTLR